MDIKHLLTKEEALAAGVAEELFDEAKHLYSRKVEQVLPPAVEDAVAPNASPTSEATSKEE